MKKTSRKRAAPKRAAKSAPQRTAGSGRMRAEYDFRGGERGKYAAQFAKGTNLVVLEPDVAAAFRDGAAVNRALRALLEITPPTRARGSRKRTA